MELVCGSLSSCCVQWWYCFLDYRKMLVYWSLEILTLAQPNTFDFGMILIATWTRERERERREREMSEQVINKGKHSMKHRCDY